MHFTYKLSNKYTEQELAFATWIATDVSNSRVSFAYASCDTSDNQGE